MKKHEIDINMINKFLVFWLDNYIYDEAHFLLN